MHSIADFESRVQRDLAWRKRELSYIRASARRSNDTSWHVFRSAQVMLCAHWEGFLKKAVRLYVEYIFSQNLRIEELSPRLLAIALFEDVLHAAEAKYPGSEGNHLRLAEKVLAVVNGGLSVSGWNVETEGNPGTDVLEKILKTIGIDHNLAMDAATWAATKIFINDHIVWDRHKVAHGEGYRIEKGSLLARIERLLSLLDILASNLLNAAEQKAYLRR